ncbi:MAG: biotin/lipoyl-containing protein [Oscillospiraceae bacterium]
MKRFNISVNCTAYDVCVEEISADGVKMPVANATPLAPPTPEKSATQQAPTTNAQGEKIVTPMPGTIVDVKVKEGDSVSENQVVVILEAMKMENEIVSTCAGTVNAVSVKKGDSVSTGDTLIIVG